MKATSPLDCYKIELGINKKIDIQASHSGPAIQVMKEGLKARFEQNTSNCDSDDLTQTELKGYTLIPQGRSSSTKGGLIIYLHETFDYDYKLKLNKYKSNNTNKEGLKSK